MSANPCRDAWLEARTMFVLAGRLDMMPTAIRGHKTPLEPSLFVEGAKMTSKPDW